jgi:hypothetical protein
LGDGPPSFPQGSTCPAVLRNKFKSRKCFIYRTLTFFGGLFQNPSITLPVSYSLFRLRPKLILSYNPTLTTPVSLHKNGLGMFPVRSPLLRESLTCFLFLGVLRWFTSPGSLRCTYGFSTGFPEYSSGRVAPFGNLRVKTCSRFTVAYRSLPRPSSPLDAKAFTVCPS